MHPVQRDCDSNDPKKFAAWCWAAGIPDPSPARPQAIPLIHPILTEGVSQMLWDFGFRHHPELQKRWIEGCAGLGTLAQIVDKKPVDDPVESICEEFLAEKNPQLLEAVRKAPKEEREKLIRDLEKNFAVLEDLLKRIKEV